MPSVDVIYIITTRQFVRPRRGIERQGGVPLVIDTTKHPNESVIFASLTP